MAAQPTENDVETLMSITGVPRQEAIQRLKGNNNDVNQAVNELFENPDSGKRYLWNEGDFGGERDGSTSNYQPSFQVHAADDYGSNASHFAPSRPPSRTTSPISNVISLVDAHSRANPATRFSKDELADTDLQKALAQSAQEAGLPPQEYGTTSTNSVHFGPANRPDYETGSWQMVHVGSSTTQEAHDPLPSDRFRESKEIPAFLKPAPSHRLGSILTIYHSINLGREVFLDWENVLPDYGHNREWWAGKPIERRRTVQLAGDSPPAGSTNTHDRELLYELQRLMAFLDQTNRSYGSAEPLANMTSVKRAEPNDIEGKFFHAWLAARRDSQVTGVIFSSALQPKNPGLDDESDLDPDRHKFAILDLDLPAPTDGFEEAETLYDLADKLLWQTSGLEISSSAYLEHVGEIISFRLSGGPSSKSVQIPEIWYPDRYLEAAREAACEMRKQKAAVRDNIKKMYSLENKLTYFTLPGGRLVKVKDLFDASLLHDAEPMMEDGSDSTPTNTIDTEMDSEPRVGDKINISAELKRVMSSIDAKLKAMNEEKEKALATLRELSKLYTYPSSNLSDPPLHRYKLSGVSTKAGITYLRQDAEPDLIDMDLDGNGPSWEQDQWWKIQYIQVEAKPVSVTKVAKDEVLKAAIEPTNSSILVYASEKALSGVPSMLPESLENFERADNLAFEGELSPDVSSQALTLSPKSPPKRKFDESEDSQEIMPRYTEPEPRWGGQSPLRDDKQILVSHRELSHPDDGDIWGGQASTSESGGSTITPPGNDLQDVIMGQDPNELVDISDASLIPSGSVQRGQEMQQRPGLPELRPIAMEDASSKSSISQSMDVDDIVGA